MFSDNDLDNEDVDNWMYEDPEDDSDIDNEELLEKNYHDNLNYRMRKVSKPNNNEVLNSGLHVRKLNKKRSVYMAKRRATNRKWD